MRSQLLGTGLVLAVLGTFATAAFAQTAVYPQTTAQTQGAVAGQNPYVAAQNPYAAAQNPYAAAQNPYTVAQNPYAAVPAAQPYHYPVAQNPYYPTPQAQPGAPAQYAAPQGPYAGQYAPAGTEQMIAACENGCCTPWTFRADELFMQRSTTRSQPLFYDGTGSAVELNSKTGLEFPVATGFQLGAIRQLNDLWSIEVSYFEMDGWIANAYLPDSNYMVTDVNGPYFEMDLASARYTSAIYMGEINFRRTTNEWLTLLGGFRMGELDERYTAVGAETSGLVGHLENSAINHLYGFQLGADSKVFDNSRFKINGLCKAGVYYNAANQSSSRYDGFVNDLVNSHADHAAFLGEVGAVATYQVTDHLAVRLVYQVAWLEGVALAPEQIGSTNFTAGTSHVDADGTLFYHGGGVGFEFKY